MNQNHTLQPLSPAEQAQTDAVVALWNATFPADLHISKKLARYNLTPGTAMQQVGQWAVVDGVRVGLIIVSTLQASDAFPDINGTSSVMSRSVVGWIDALLVQPQSQQRGIGRTLLRWAEAWFAKHGCQTIEVGGSLRPFMPGVPVALDTSAFFQHHGYGAAHQVWDLAANLAGYQPPDLVRPVDGIVRPAQPSDIAPLAEFFARAFPGRWHQGFQQFLQHNDPHSDTHSDPRISDYMVLWTERGIDGFCRLTFEDSYLPIERFYPYQLARPWGQLGPIGVSAEQRGRGFGAALLDAGLRRLHNNGVNGCVIDWTTLLDFYGRFGFTPYRAYVRLAKQLVA